MSPRYQFSNSWPSIWHDSWSNHPHGLLAAEGTSFDTQILGPKFTVTTILQRYQNFLITTNLARDSPPSPACESREHDQAQVHGARIQAREARSSRPKAINRTTGITEVSAASGGLVPDIAFYPAQQFGVGPDRAPGDMKSSWNWHTGQANGSRSQRKE
ncbi:uncharacterized protein ASPGLDRAFT_22968 [Aspergillus glaucus CBS 516.65]|uniref:Uncharacterized protein n=1 Tax=Aspergillus glaucus CBS 516.65 TaxID=1160497 RepID=A0A1L9VSJ9_ASPGL|nr:hypothetical protein ASPGLDRAFT_22968 [Aspergillus glaucus CBS 516.65]OJJ86891.1 hypothetical protein ASPGLDRAFT_22968 [Aspergillus glaucus CBS 516.65]